MLVGQQWLESHGTSPALAHVVVETGFEQVEVLHASAAAQTEPPAARGVQQLLTHPELLVHNAWHSPSFERQTAPTGVSDPVWQHSEVTVQDCPGGVHETVPVVVPEVVPDVPVVPPVVVTVPVVSPVVVAVPVVSPVVVAVPVVSPVVVAVPVVTPFVVPVAPPFVVPEVVPVVVGAVTPVVVVTTFPVVVPVVMTPQAQTE